MYDVVTSAVNIMWLLVQYSIYDMVTGVLCTNVVFTSVVYDIHYNIGVFNGVAGDILVCMLCVWVCVCVCVCETRDPPPV